MTAWTSPCWKCTQRTPKKIQTVNLLRSQVSTNIVRPRTPLARTVFFFFGWGGGPLVRLKQFRKETEEACQFFLPSRLPTINWSIFFTSLIKIILQVIMTLLKTCFCDDGLLTRFFAATRHNVYRHCFLCSFFFSFKTIFDWCIYACLDVAQLSQVSRLHDSHEGLQFAIMLGEHFKLCFADNMSTIEMDPTLHHVWIIITGRYRESLLSVLSWQVYSLFILMQLNPTIARKTGLRKSNNISPILRKSLSFRSHHFVVADFAEMLPFVIFLPAKPCRRRFIKSGFGPQALTVFLKGNILDLGLG